MVDKQHQSCVSFASEISEVSGSSYTLTDGRKEALWYSDSELEDMEENALRMVREKCQEGDDLRGLEFYTDEERCATTEERNCIMLEHLHSIRASGMDSSFDFETLGSCLNRDSIKLGEMQAAQDLAEAYMIYLETMDPEMVNPCFCQA